MTNPTSPIIYEEQKPSREFALAIHGSRAELNELKDRILRVATVQDRIDGEKVYRKLSENEALKVAMFSLSHRLDFQAEMFWMINDDGIFIVNANERGWMSAAYRQLRSEVPAHLPASFSFDVSGMTKEERELYGVPDKAIAYKAHLRDTSMFNAITDLLKAASAIQGSRWEDIFPMIGKPLSLGIGWYIPRGGGFDSNFPPHSRAMKRARMAALRSRFALPFNEFEDGYDEVPAEYIGKQLGEGKKEKPPIINQTAQPTADPVAASMTTEAPAQGEQEAKQGAPAQGAGANLPEDHFVPDPKAIDEALKAKKASARALFPDDDDPFAGQGAKPINNNPKGRK